MRSVFGIVGWVPLARSEAVRHVSCSNPLLWSGSIFHHQGLESRILLFVQQGIQGKGLARTRARRLSHCKHTILFARMDPEICPSGINGEISGERLESFENLVVNLPVSKPRSIARTFQSKLVALSIGDNHLKLD
jgi:hypothetical protein